MANAGTGAVKIIDNDNDVVTVTNNKLDVNATLVAGASIDIGDVEVKGHSSVQSYRNRTVGTTKFKRIYKRKEKFNFSIFR